MLVGDRVAPHRWFDRPVPSVKPTVRDLVVVLDLDALADADSDRVAADVAASRRITVGIARETTRPAGSDALLSALTLSLGPAASADRRVVPVDDIDAALDCLLHAVDGAPQAAYTLAGLLPITTALPTVDALVAESAAYSTLLAGSEFARWRAANPPRAIVRRDDALLLSRDADTLHIALNRPHRANAVDSQLRDALVEALLLVVDDPEAHLEIRGVGAHFCSGGDLDEFGSTDPATAHLVRTAQSPPALLSACAPRVTAHVHGACVGAGVELAAFAGTVIASPDAWFALPEVALGLLPGSGGTISIPRRIGRWRTAWLAITGQRVTAETARSWGLVDTVVT